MCFSITITCHIYIFQIYINPTTTSQPVNLCKSVSIILLQLPARHSGVVGSVFDSLLSCRRFDSLRFHFHVTNVQWAYITKQYNLVIWPNYTALAAAKMQRLYVAAKEQVARQKIMATYHRLYE